MRQGALGWRGALACSALAVCFWARGATQLAARRSAAGRACVALQANVVQLGVANAAAARATRGSAAPQEGLARANAAVVGDVVCAACVGSQPYVIGRVVAAAVEAKAATRAVTGQVKAGDVVLELQRFVVVAAEIRLQRKSAG